MFCKTTVWDFQQEDEAVVKGAFRHDINLHHIAFAAIAVVTQGASLSGGLQRQSQCE